VEMALASEKEIEVDLEKIHIYEESRILCHEYGLDPLGVIASGALLFTISPVDLSTVQQIFTEVSMPIQVIGKIKEGSTRVFARNKEGDRELKPVSRDEILKIYESPLSPLY